MTEIKFKKQKKFWVGSFQADGNDVFVYINRKGNGFLSIATTPNEEDCRPCLDYADTYAFSDICLKTKYPSGVKVIITSASEVEYCANKIADTTQSNG